MIEKIPPPPIGLETGTASSAGQPALNPLNYWDSYLTKKSTCNCIFILVFFFFFFITFFFTKNAKGLVIGLKSVPAKLCRLQK